MYINTITSSMEKFYGKKIKVVTELGKYKDYNIAIRKEIQGNKVVEKQFVFWNKSIQKISNKIRNSSGKFDRIG